MTTDTKTMFAEYLVLQNELFSGRLFVAVNDNPKWRRREDLLLAMRSNVPRIELCRG